MGSTISYYLSSASMQNLKDYMNDYDNENYKNYSINNLNLTQYYVLNIYIDPDVPESIKKKYLDSVNEHNLLVDAYINANNNYYNTFVDMNDYCLNAGFDLFCPDNIESKPSQQVVIDHKIICSMKLEHKYVSYYLYSRSSTPVKTPLRLANSVGIIDSGYRGNIKAIFDNIHSPSSSTFNITQNNRYVQICPPNIEYPMKIVIVDNLDDLGTTYRSDGGFGSTGK